MSFVLKCWKGLASAQGPGNTVACGKLRCWQGTRNFNLADWQTASLTKHPAHTQRKAQAISSNKETITTRLDFPFKSALTHFRLNQECYGDGGLSAKQLQGIQTRTTITTKRFKLKVKLSLGGLEWDPIQAAGTKCQQWVSNQIAAKLVETIVGERRTKIFELNTMPDFFWAKLC